MHIQIAIAIIYLQEEEMQVPLLQLTFDEGANSDADDTIEEELRGCKWTDRFIWMYVLLYGNNDGRPAK